MKIIRILVVDDSVFMRKTIVKALSKFPEFEVVGEATDGREGVRMVRDLRPDVVTMDVNMPEMDGIEAARAIMAETPTPIVMISTRTSAGAAETMRALEVGAVDFVQKPDGEKMLDWSGILSELADKIRIAATSRVSPYAPPPSPRRAEPLDDADAVVGEEYPIVAVGSSTGGPRVLNGIFRRLPPGFPAAIVVAQHMPAEYTAGLAERLGEISALPVREAARGDHLEPGVALIAPGGYHMEVLQTGMVRLHQREEKQPFTPSVDVLFRSLAKRFARRTIAVLLSGMGSDGAEGMREVKSGGGRTIAQSERTCIVFGMPRSAIEFGCVDRVEDADRIGDAVVEVVGGMTKEAKGGRR